MGKCVKFRYRHSPPFPFFASSFSIQLAFVHQTITNDLESHVHFDV